ncbi:ras-related protein Rab-38 isoform X2 [Tenebrio molitor]|uniref:ras-related protein Rab-38 isoform X2 n=1 Tax=Tenebrio molitor TaxID=7067 RepID=UPI003624A3A0
MIEEVPEKRLNRRTRGERNKRRERYFLFNESYDYDTESDDLSDDMSPPSTPPANNNFFKDGEKSSGEGKPKTSYANKTTERKDHLYKILVIGDLGAGKTSIIKRYVHRFFTQHYRATIGVDFALKVLNWDENTLIRLQLWDIAGQERYGNMTRVYYKEAVGAFIVFDVTRITTFESVAKWKTDLDSKVQLSDGSPIPCVLLANKCDQPKEGLVNNHNKMDEYCKENGFTAWFETSAKDNINIDEAARALVNKILENDTLLNVESAKDQEKFSITKEANAQRNGKLCSC